MEENHNECLHVQFSRQYMLKLLSFGIRMDGRMPDAGRPVTLTVGSITTADSSSLLRCGDTVVICGVKLELLSTSESKAGSAICNVDCGSGCLPEATAGPPSAEVQTLTKQLQLVLNEYINTELLIVENSELVWVVNVDLICLSHDGNLLDAFTLAALAALQNVKIPTINLESNEPKITEPTGVGLPLLKPFLTVSFALLENWCLLDPSLKEERCAQGHLSISLHSNGGITRFHHSGCKLTEQELIRLYQLAMKRVTPLNELLLHT